MAAHVKTTVVGSYPMLPWMVGNPSRLVLRDAVMAVLKTQELAGLDLVTDGELVRFDASHPEANGMVDYFVSRLDGIRRAFSPADFERSRADRVAGSHVLAGMFVVGPITEGSLNLPLDCDFSRSLTRLPFKFTCTGPHMLARVLTNCHYPDLPALAMDVAKVLRSQLALVEADTVQLDEASIVGFPQDAEWAADAINYVLDGVLSEKAVHLCFGNYGGQPMLRGFWRDMVPFLNRLHADHLVLEFARRGYDELEVFRDLKPSVALGVGVVDIKDNAVEAPDEIARRIERAVRTLGPERVRWVHPDCGFWMLHRSVADRKMRVLVEGRDHFLGMRGGAPA